MTVLVAPHSDDRMHDEMDAQPVPRQLHAERVDEEWHVVGDDVDDRVRRVVPVLLERRGVHPYERLTGLALLGEPQVCAGRALAVVGRALLGVVGGEVRVVEGDEASEQARRHQCHPPGISS